MSQDKNFNTSQSKNQNKQSGQPMKDQKYAKSDSDLNESRSTSESGNIDKKANASRDSGSTGSIDNLDDNDDEDVY